MQNYFGMHKTIIFIAIIIFAFILRFYHLSSVPPSPSLDEVSLGWNAYSIFHTGRDEYGTFFPILLRAYDDYRPALYVYLILPFLFIFGLTVEAVRAPSVVLSLLTVVATFFLAKILTKNMWIGLIAMVLLAISPWHIYISRLGHEVNAGLAFGVIGIALFFYYIYECECNKTSIIAFSLFSFVLALYSYQSQKIIIPIIVCSLFGLFFRVLLKQFKKIIVLLFFCFILLFPLILVTFSDKGLIRFQGTTVFNGSHPFYERDRLAFVQAREEKNIFVQLWHHPRLTSLKIFLQQYMSHFSFSWLFQGKAYEAHKVPYMGLLYPWELPFILIGFVLAYKLFSKKVFFFMMIWFLSSPIPAAITTQAPHAMRSYTFLPTWQVFGAIGLWHVFSRYALLKKSVITVAIFLFVISVSLYHFYRNYFFVFPRDQSEAFSYAAADAMKYLLNYRDAFDSIVISNRLGQRYSYPSYMFFLFFSRYHPKMYHHYGGTQSGSFDAHHAFDVYEFRSIKKNERNEKTLYVTNYFEDHQGIRVQYIARYLNETPGVILYVYE